MWLLFFLCTLTAVGGVPVRPTEETTGHTTDNATVTSMLDAPKPDTTTVRIILLNDTHNVTTPAAVTSMLDSAKPETEEACDTTLNDTNNVTTPAAENATVTSMHDAPKPDTAAVTAVPVNDTHNVTTPAAVTSMHDAPKPDTAAVTVVPVNDTHNVTTPAAVTSMLDSPKPSKAAVTVFNDTHNVTSPAAGASLLQPLPAEAETLEELQDDVFVQEGDIVMLEDRNAVESLWADATVAYSISHELADQEFNILSAFRMISDFTCIRFVPRTHEINYLQFVDGKGCASFVGCRGGAQKLYYARSCSVGNLCHELIHALGLHHEHTRPDRDQFITVHWESIKPGKERNFNVKQGNTLNLPYDLESITHYGSFFFSVDGSPTMLSKHNGANIGQRTHLSQLDIERLNRLYRCDQRMRG